MPSEMDIAYCAGLFDGEGIVSLHRHRIRQTVVRLRPHYRYEQHLDARQLVRTHPYRFRLHLGINQVKPEAIFLMQQTFGGNVTFQKRNSGPNPNKEYSGRWWWKLNDHRAADCLTEMLPCLRLKRDEALLAIQFQSTKQRSFKGCPGMKFRTAETIEFQHFVFLELQRLKHAHNDSSQQLHYQTMSTPQPLRQ